MRRPAPATCRCQVRASRQGGRGGAPGGTAPSGEGRGVAPVLRNQILARREHQPAREGQEKRLGDTGAEPLDEAARLAHVDQRVAEVVVVGKRGPAEGPLEVGELESFGQTAPQHRHRRPLVLAFDGGDECLFIPVAGAVRKRMARLSQHVVGDVRDTLQEAGEAGFIVAFVLVVEGEPVRGAGIRMGPPELHAIEGPVNGLAQCIEGIRAEPVQPRKLASHAFVGVVLASFGEAGQDPGASLGERWVRQVDPDLPAAHFHRVDAQPFSAVEVLSASQIELPVVPVAGEDATFVEAALAQRIPLVRATVVAGEHAVPGVEQGDLPSFRAEQEPAPFREDVEGCRPCPGVASHGVPSRRSRRTTIGDGHALPMSQSSARPFTADAWSDGQ